MTSSKSLIFSLRKNIKRALKAPLINHQISNSFRISVINYLSTPSLLAAFLAQLLDFLTPQSLIDFSSLDALNSAISLLLFSRLEVIEVIFSFLIANSSFTSVFNSLFSIVSLGDMLFESDN